MKFEKGEIVLIVHGGGFVSPDCQGFIGMEAEILDLPGEFEHTEFSDDYRLKAQNGIVIYARERCLRKKRPPEQPSAFSYDEIISMCNDKSITDIRPTERQVREGLRGILHPFGEKAGEKT